MRSSLLILAALATTATPRPAHACGPDFDPRRLADRSSILFELSPEKFADTVGDLVSIPPADARFAVVLEPETDDATAAAKAARARGGDRERALYDEGASAFDRDAMAEARDAFKQLLELPVAERKYRSTWAAYMIARSYGLVDNNHLAIAAYEEVRALARAGFVDELGLAASSLGQEARLQYRQDDTITAVHLYAEQAALGHPDGAPSLLTVAGRVAVDPELRATLLHDPVGQRLVVAYLATRGDDLVEADRVVLWRELSAIAHLAGADRLAAVAYAHGDWVRAGALALIAPHERRSLWVLAKLAARTGDLAAAEQFLAEATSCDATPWTHDRIASERTIVALGTDRPRDALAHAWEARATAPADLAYVAERVATIDELRAFVDALPPPRTLPESDDYGWTATEASLRELLARRLVRAGRAGESPPYFSPPHAVRAHEYADALARGRDAGADPFTRAGALLEAAAIARHDGLEILGTEAAPDWNLYGAQYDRTEDDERDRDRESDLAGTPPRDRVPLTDAEHARVADSAPERPERYHYRYVASELAEQAADLLPHQSQAFAAALCHATKYIFYTDADRRDALYRRYIHEGPSVDFAGTFGQECPAADIERARRFAPTPAQRARRHHVPRSTLVLLSLACLAAAYVLARRLAYLR